MTTRTPAATRQHLSVDPAVAARQRQPVEPYVDTHRAIPGGGVERSVESAADDAAVTRREAQVAARALHGDGAVAGSDRQSPAHVGDHDVTVAGLQGEVGLARGPDLDAQLAHPKFKQELDMGRAHLERHSVLLLVLVD